MTHQARAHVLAGHRAPQTTEGRVEGSTPAAVNAVTPRPSVPTPAPDWPEGTIAWVRGAETEWLLQRRGGRWFDGSGDGAISYGDYNVTAVRPLRILGDDEVAVKRGHRSIVAITSAYVEAEAQR